jgi:hypothetical protein
MGLIGSPETWQRPSSPPDRARIVAVHGDERRDKKGEPASGARQYTVAGDARSWWPAARGTCSGSAKYLYQRREEPVAGG